MLSRMTVRLVFLLVALLALGGVASAGQADTTASVIGQVTDESNAVMPGVTVTLTGPALQVPELVTITNERGEYRLTPLPIGTYTVVYSLAGFQSVRRENLRLTAGFIATLDIVLKVGSLEESVTVSGVSPVVDVASTGARTAFTRETLELNPTGRNGIISLLAQTPSVRSNFDVGGSASSDTVSLRVYGINSESWQTLEGIVTTESRDTQGGNYFDYSSLEEARAQTLSNEANVPARGVYVNMLVKSGGNNFHGSGFGASTSRGLQSNNIDDKLRAQGFTQGTKLNARWDTSGDIGGPLVLNKLWFYQGNRYRRQDKEVLGVFKPDGTPGNNYQSQAYSSTKLSYQMTPGNRLVGFYFFHRKRDEAGAMTPQRAWEARDNSTVTTPMGKVEWQGVKGNGLVMSMQYSFWRWTAIRIIPDGVGPSASDQAKLTFWGINNTQGNDSAAWRTCPAMKEVNDPCRPMLKGSVSWYRSNLFAGNHEFNTGFDYIPNSTTRPWRHREVGDYRLIYNNDAPFQIVTLNAPTYPITSAIHTGIYVKDNWTLHRRVSLNLGVRYAHDNGFVPAQCKAVGQFSEAACTDRIQDTIWNSWSPRIYAAYDITGNAKTVIKGGWGRFSHFRTTDEVLSFNPFVGTQTTYRWNDANKNLAYDPGEVNLAVNGPDFVSSSITDTSAPTDGVVNPNEKQPIEDEFSASLEREVASNFALRVSGRHSRRFNVLRREYLRRPYSVYNIPITNPDPGPDGRLNTADDTGQLFTYYDFPAAFGGRLNQQNQLAVDPNATETFNTIELAGTKRLSAKWQIMASWSATKVNIPVPAYTALNPNEEINTGNNTWESLGRLSGAYQFPAGLTTSFNFDHRSGLARARQVLFTRAGAQVPSLVVNGEPIGSLHDPDTNVLDLRLEKTFRVGGGRSIQGQANLFNALNVNTPTGVTYRSGAAFLQPTAIILPRILEFSVSYRF